jgi:hypothetical protein
VYQVQFREPFYKGGRLVDRVPSWTDRILYHTLPSKRSRLVPEPLDPTNPETSPHNYQAVNQSMDISDHSPVFCTFSLMIAADCLVTDRAAKEAETEEAAASGADKARSGSLDSDDAPAGGMPPKTPKSKLAAQLHPTALVVVLKITDIQVEFRGQLRMPRAVNVLFPLPYEDSDDLPVRAKIVR